MTLFCLNLQVEKMGFKGTLYLAEHYIVLHQNPPVYCIIKKNTFHGFSDFVVADRIKPVSMIFEYSSHAAEYCRRQDVQYMQNTENRATSDLKQKSIQYVQLLILQPQCPLSTNPPLSSIRLPNAGLSMSVLQTAARKN